MIDTRLAPYAALLLRLTMGVAFVAHALFKVMVFGMAVSCGTLRALGCPIDGSRARQQSASR